MFKKQFVILSGFLLIVLSFFVVSHKVSAQVSGTELLQKQLDELLRQLQTLQAEVMKKQPETATAPVVTNIPKTEANASQSITQSTPTDKKVVLDEVPGEPAVSCILPPLARGAKSNEVYLLQMALRKTEFYKDGFTTGYYGKLTELAIQKLQSNYKYLATGKLEGETLSLVNSKFIPESFSECRNVKLGGSIGVVKPPQPVDQLKSETVPSVPTLAWKTYQNSKFNFSFQYPGDFGITEETGSNEQLIIRLTKKNASFQLRVNSPVGLDADYQPTGASKEIVVGGKTGEFSIGKKDESHFLFLVKSIDYGNKRSVSFHMYASSDTEKTEKDVFISILNTFVIDETKAAITLTVVSPNGGEIYRVGEKIVMKWESKNLPSTGYMSIQLKRQTGELDGSGNPYYYGEALISKNDNTTLNDGYEEWIIPSSVTLDDRYVIEISGCVKDVNSSEGARCSAYDRSDNPFAIIKREETPAEPVNQVLGDVTLLGGTAERTSGGGVIVKENFKAEVFNYPTSKETEGPPASYRGFYELMATYREKTALLPLYNIIVGKFSKTDSYPKSGTFTLTDRLEPNKEYVAEFYLQEYPWGSYSYNKFLVDTVSFTTPAAPVATTPPQPAALSSGPTTPPQPAITTISGPITVTSEIGEATFLNSTAEKTSSGATVVKANFKAKINSYPTKETTLPSGAEGYRGFYELSATYKQKGSLTNLYAIVVGRFNKTDTYPKEGSFVLTDLLQPSKDYTVDINFSEYPWGSYPYNKYSVGTIDFSTPPAPTSYLQQLEHQLANIYVMALRLNDEAQKLVGR